MPTNKIIATTFVVGAGVSVALQQVVNARLRAELGSPWWAGVTSYSVGLLAMLAAVLLSGERLPPSATLARVPWPFWTGGLFGAIFVGTGIVMVPRLGAASVLALVVVGQMFGSLLFDQIGLFGLTPHPLSLARVVGASLLVLGVVLVRA